MTMFRRVFSNHFDAQGKQAEASRPEVLRQDIPPAPPSLPPPLKLPEKSALTELEARPRTGPARPIAPTEGVDDVDPEIVARATELHAQMQQRGAHPVAVQMAILSTPQAPLSFSAVENTGLEGTSAQPRRSARARTRLLGFDSDGEIAPDPIAQAKSNTPPATRIKPAGWVVVIKGAGVGHHFALYSGVAMVGRGEGQTIRLDFGDQTISRQNHAALAYDSEDNKFYLGHGGKSNIVKLNGRPVLSTEEIFDRNTIRIGETTLRLITFCGEDFRWGEDDDA